MRPALFSLSRVRGRTERELPTDEGLEGAPNFYQLAGQRCSQVGRYTDSDRYTRRSEETGARSEERRRKQSRRAEAFEEGIEWTSQDDVTPTTVKPIQAARPASMALQTFRLILPSCSEVDASLEDEVAE